MSTEISLMLLLENGKYLGDIKKSFSADDIQVSLITYSQPDFHHDAPQWHAHENTHHTFFLEGGTLESRKNETHKRYAGDVTFYQAGEPHLNTGTIFPSRNLNVEIGSAFLKKYNITDHTISQNFSHYHARIVLLKLYKELIREDVNTTSLHMNLLQILLSKSASTHTFPKWTKRIKEYLTDNWDETPSLEQLCAIAGVHPVTISKNFGRYFQCTLSEYLRKIKVEKAISLIRSTKQTLEEIGFICGFADKSHFTRVFKEQTGYLPGEYRKL